MPLPTLLGGVGLWHEILNQVNCRKFFWRIPVFVEMCGFEVARSIYVRAILRDLSLICKKNFQPGVITYLNNVASPPTTAVLTC